VCPFEISRTKPIIYFSFKPLRVRKSHDAETLHAYGGSAERENSNQRGFLFAGGTGRTAPAATAAMKTLDQNMLKLKLDVALHVPIHGHVGTNVDFVKIVGNGQ
jgi:hypothetical protein